MVQKPIQTKKSTKKSSSSSKYASKIVGEAMTKVIDEKLKKMKKNRKTTEKWCNKMKLSIQRKVSEASKVLFNQSGAELNREVLETKLLALKDRIRTREERIARVCIAQIKANSFHDIPALAEAGSYVPKQFDSQTMRINALFGQLATQLDDIRKELPSQVQKLKSVVQVVDNTWQQKFQPNINADSDSNFQSSSTSTSSYSPSYQNSRIQSHLNNY